jgi:hypothetical protein
MILVVSIILIAGVLAFVLLVRPNAVPEAVPGSPVAHLEERRAAIYENLRDLNFEYRLGKLSDADYQKTKIAMQRELAVVLADIDRVLGAQPEPPPPPPPPARPAPKVEKPVGFVCPHCNARFDKPMKFCGECGQPMGEGGA